MTDMQNLLTVILGMKAEALRTGTCPPPPFGCGKPVDPATLRDEVSKREFGISGLCQACQDEFFKEPEE